LTFLSSRAILTSPENALEGTARAVLADGGNFDERGGMPEISRFFGIVIAMYFKEHAPPHFHAKYGSQRGAFSIEDLRLTEGRLPQRVVSLVLEWAFQHREELMDNWRRAEHRERLQRIEPLV
jgi:hypothetical protein